MNSDEEDDIARPESLPVYRKGKEILLSIYLFLNA